MIAFASSDALKPVYAFIRTDGELWLSLDETAVGSMEVGTAGTKEGLTTWWVQGRRGFLFSSPTEKDNGAAKTFKNTALVPLWSLSGDDPHIRAYASDPKDPKVPTSFENEHLLGFMFADGNGPGRVPLAAFIGSEDGGSAGRTLFSLDFHEGDDLSGDKNFSGLRFDRYVGWLCGTDDADGSGEPACLDACPMDPKKLAPGDCGCGAIETDRDGDGTKDCVDACPLDPRKASSDGRCGCFRSENDSDGDGTPDCVDGCPVDAAKSAPGECGCGSPDVDSDEDGAIDCFDLCPYDAAKKIPGMCGCGEEEDPTDTNDNGQPDCSEVKPRIDSDGDGALDDEEECPHDPKKKKRGMCGCGRREDDSDGDGVPDCRDACEGGLCENENDSDGRSEPQIVGPDSDGDGVLDDEDECPHDPGKEKRGTCGCGRREDDSDGDGVPDCRDACEGGLCEDEDDGVERSEH
jgi:hypothetical protein